MSQSVFEAGQRLFGHDPSSTHCEDEPLDEDRPFPRRQWTQSDVSWVSESLFKQHAAWVKQGRVGSGGLVLQGWYPRGGRFHGSVLTGLIVQDAFLDESQMHGAQLDEAQFRSTDFKGTNMLMGRLERSRWQDCAFRDGSLGAAYLDDSELRRCTFRNSELGRSRWTRVRLEDVSVDDSLAIRAKFEGTTFRNCVFRNVNLEDAKFEDLDLANNPNNLRFENCKLQGATWNGEPFVPAALPFVCLHAE